MDFNRSHLVAWAAGIIDGEGSVQICRSYRDPVRFSEQFYSRVEIQCTSKDMLTRMAELFGGPVQPINSVGHRKLSMRQMWRWRLFSVKAAAALQEMMPFLVSKRKHAEIVLEFQDRCFATAYRNTRLSETELALRVRYYEELRDMQIKGPYSKGAQKKQGNYSKLIAIQPTGTEGE